MDDDLAREEAPPKVTEPAEKRREKPVTIQEPATVEAVDEESIEGQPKTRVVVRKAPLLLPPEMAKPVSNGKTEV